MADSEPRIAPRKVLRCRAKVMINGGRPPLIGRTVDISISGLCVMLESPLVAGESCVIAFDAPVNGTMRKIMVSAKAVYSIYGGEGFRTGFQFVQLDAANTSIINQLVR